MDSFPSVCVPSGDYGYCCAACEATSLMHQAIPLPLVAGIFAAGRSFNYRSLVIRSSFGSRACSAPEPTTCRTSNKRPGADVEWRVLFAFGPSRLRAAQAGRSAATTYEG